MGRRRKLILVCLLAPIHLSACSSDTVVGIADIKTNTGIDLCPNAIVTDVTTAEERSTTPGFSYHVELDLDQPCDVAFLTQLNTHWPHECSSDILKVNGCAILDTRPRSNKRATAIIRRLSEGSYDFRFYQ